jgi:hypothetical protein
MGLFKEEKEKLEIKLRVAEDDLIAYEHSKEARLNNYEIISRIRRKIERKKKYDAEMFALKMRTERIKLQEKRLIRKEEVEEIIESENKIEEKVVQQNEKIK